MAPFCDVVFRLGGMLRAAVEETAAQSTGRRLRMEPPAMNLQIIFPSIFGKSRRAMPRNPSVERGAWGEDLAARHLSSLGWRVLERNARPFSHDRRCELDIVAFIASENKVVFVEVKTHKRRNGKAPRMWGIDKNKKRIVSKPEKG
jgi:Holliday junction resolvase-like predicted endonuclease